jgi:threonyl-tRNA synthetase
LLSGQLHNAMSSRGLHPKFETRMSSSGIPVIARRDEVWSPSELTVPESFPLGATAPAAAAAGPADKSRIKTRLTKESGARAEGGAGKIGGAFKRGPNPSFIAARAAVYDAVMAAQRARLAAKPREPISITLPDGAVREGVSWETTPLAVAEAISKGLAGSVVVARVTYTRRVGAEEADGAGAIANTGPEEPGDDDEAAPGGGGGGGAAKAAKPELWDLTRPLEGDCKLELLKFDDPEGKMVRSV